MHRHLLIIILMVCSIAIAGVLVVRLTPASAQVVRLTVSDLDVSTEGGGVFGQFRSWLGIRRPQKHSIAPGTSFTVHASAYAPSPHQTDSTPCTTAAGTRVRRGTVASNFLPLGTILNINDQLYMVEDRMNPRFKKSIDIYFPSTSQALEFGRQKLTIEVVGYGEPGQSLPTTLRQKIAAGVSDHRLAVTSSSNILTRMQGQFIFVGRTFAQLIGARSVADLNRYDVDCL